MTAGKDQLSQQPIREGYELEKIRGHLGRSGRRRMMSYYITKYALSAGIKEVSEDDFEEDNRGIYGNMPGSYYPSGFYGKEWHRTMDAAIVRAEEMRVARIVSMKKSIAKMEKLDFTKDR